MMGGKVKAIYMTILRKYGPDESPVSIRTCPWDGGLISMVVLRARIAKHILKELTSEHKS